MISSGIRPLFFSLRANRSVMEQTLAYVVDASLSNADLAPVPADRRTWGIYNYAALWIGMSVCIPTYMLASGLIAGGMNWWQAIGTILLGNLIVLVPMLLNAHAGTKYGIPFPVFVRASFGVRGANIPAVLRALVACGWFGIQTWIGGQAIYTMLGIVWPTVAHSEGWLWGCFFAFWALNIYVVWRGLDTIKFIEGVSAPFMLAVGLLLLWWITNLAGGMGPVLRAPSKFRTPSEFIAFFIPSLTGMVGFWATVALNIPDFTRYARSQKAQVWGQALGLPTTMTLYAFIGVAVTSASVLIFGEPIWDPVVLLGRLNRPVVALVALVAQCCRQCGVAFERLFELEPAAHLLPHGRHDHRGHRSADDALETAQRRPCIHLRLAGWVLQFAGSDRGYHDRRLFYPAEMSAGCGRAVLARGALCLLKRSQLARRGRTGHWSGRGPVGLGDPGTALAL